MIITIDGPAGTGKSTIARQIADSLNFVYFDTGAMYRTFTLFSMQRAVDPEDHDALSKLLPDFHYDIRIQDEQKCYFLNDEDVSEAIRTREVTALVSQVAAAKEVRSGMVEVQRGYAQGVDAVFEGRDLGTVVFPNALLKIFLTASAEVRAKRRYKELQEKSAGSPLQVTLEMILKEINERDDRDRTRLISPLCQADDAVLIDTSYLSIESVVEAVLEAKAAVDTAQS